MNLPPSITFEQVLLGHGDGTTVRGQENGNPVVVKSPDVLGDFIGRVQIEDEPKQGSGSRQFEAEKRRESEIAARSDCYLKGRLLRHSGDLFWVRPFASSSLHDMVAFKEKPRSSALNEICRSIIQALSALHTIDQAGHGNLSLGNVLIPGNTFRDLKLVDLRAANPGNTLADQRALGLIIYQLVNGEFVGLDDMISSVPEGQDWSLLGAAAPKWKAFCSELLNPYGKYAQSSWESIEADLRVIDRGVGKGVKVLLVFSLLLLSGAGAFYAWQYQRNSEERAVNLSNIQGQWLELLDEYFSWGGNYLKSKGDFEHRHDAPEFMKRFYDETKASLPLEIIGRVSGQGARLQTAPLEAYEVAKGINVVPLKDQLKQISEAHQFLIGLHAEIENWEVRRELSEAHASFLASGFEFGAQKTRDLLDSISLEDGSLSLSRLYALQIGAARLDQLQGEYTRFGALLVELRGQSQSRFLLVYADASEEQLAQSAGDTVAQLRRFIDTASELLTFWEAQQALIEQRLFAESERMFLAESDFSVSDDSLLEWKALVERYQLIDIPLLEEAHAQFNANEETIDHLTRQINELQGADVEAVAYNQEFAQIFQRLREETELPTVAGNREAIESAARMHLSSLQALMDQAEKRLVEVNPNIAEQLQQLASQPGTLSGALLAAWEVYLDDEVRVRTEGAFAGPREYLDFRKAHEAKLKRFEEFQRIYLSQISSNWGGRISPDIRKELVPALEETRRAYYDSLISEWVAGAVPKLLNVSDGASLDAPAQTQAYIERMQAYEVRLLAYTQLLDDTLGDLESWDLPAEGMATRWEVLNDEEANAGFARSAAFAPFHEQVRRSHELEQRTSVNELLTIAMDGSQSGFIRMRVLRRVSELATLTPEALEQIAALAPGLRSQVPAARAAAFESTLLALWTRSFEDPGLAKDARERVLSYCDVMGVRGADLGGRTRVQFEIYTALQDLRGNELLYTEQPEMLARIANTLYLLPGDSNDEQAKSIVDELREVDLNQTKAAFEDAAFLRMGWEIESETEEQLILRWRTYQIVFHRVEDTKNDFFLAEQECSIGLFNDWMSANHRWERLAASLPSEWEIFISKRYSEIDDYRIGMRLWSIARNGLKRGGIELSPSWFPVGPSVIDEYLRIEPDVCPRASLSETLPIQHIGARLALAFAESMGMVLPSPGQWKLAVQGYSGNGAYFWQAGMQGRLTDELVSQLQQGSFYSDAEIAESGYGADKSEILSPVNENANRQFKHLAGNVAEYLYNPDDDTYHVAGGSALAVVAETWKAEHLLSKRVEDTAFSDVGIRLALIAPKQSAYNQFLAIYEAAWE